MGNYTEIVTIALRLIVAILIAVVIPALKAWMESKIENEKLGQIQEWARSAVYAAEQAYKQYKTTDPKGIKRKEYARVAIMAVSSRLGLKLTDKEINTLIEAAVNEINAFRH